MQREPADVDSYSVIVHRAAYDKETLQGSHGIVAWKTMISFEGCCETNLQQKRRAWGTGTGSTYHA